MSTYGTHNDTAEAIEAARNGAPVWTQLAVAGEDHGYTVRGSDAGPVVVVKRSANGKRVWVKDARAVLLNRPNSGASDALTAHAGGFSAHVSGTQRWGFYEPHEDAPVEEYTARKSGRFVRKGEPDVNGACTLRMGELFANYDYNF